MKNIHELTKRDAKEILKSIEDGKEGEDWVFDKLSFSPIINENGSQRVTFCGNSIIGICYHAGPNWDSYVKYFSDLKVMKWLYQHNYDIEELIQDRIDGEKEDEEYINYFFKEREEMRAKIRKYEKELEVKNEKA